MSHSLRNRKKNKDGSFKAENYCSGPSTPKREASKAAKENFAPQCLTPNTKDKMDTLSRTYTQNVLKSQGPPSHESIMCSESSPPASKFEPFVVDSPDLLI